MYSVQNMFFKVKKRLSQKLQLEREQHLLQLISLSYPFFSPPVISSYLLRTSYKSFGFTDRGLSKVPITPLSMPNLRCNQLKNCYMCNKEHFTVGSKDEKI